MVSLKSAVTAGSTLLVGIILAGCSASPTPPATVTDASPSASAAPTVSKPVATQGKSILEIYPYDVSVDQSYFTETGATPDVATDAVAISLETMKVFTSDFAKYRKKSEALNQEELLALLPDVQNSLKPLMTPDNLNQFSQKWTEQASDPANLENTTLMLATDDADGSEEDMWENAADLPCGLSDAEWTTTFTNPRLEYSNVEGIDYKITVFRTTGHYLVPCADGKVLGVDMDWELQLGPNAANTTWEVYKWERKNATKIAYVQ